MSLGIMEIAGLAAPLDDMQSGGRALIRPPRTYMPPVPPHRQAKDTERHSSHQASRLGLLTEPDNVPPACLSLDAYTSNSPPADLQTLPLQ